MPKTLEHTPLFSDDFLDGDTTVDAHVRQATDEFHAKGDAADALADKAGMPVAQARAIIGVGNHTPQVELPVAVDVEARADAMEKIVAWINAYNRERGATAIRASGYPNAFDERYTSYAQHSDDVKDGMNTKVAILKKQRDDALDTLVAAEAIRHNDDRRGVPKHETEERLAAERKKLLRDIWVEAGAPGARNVQKRKKMVATTRRTANALKGTTK